MAYRTVNDHIAGVDLIYRGFPAKRLQMVRDAVAHEAKLLPGWLKMLTVSSVRSKRYRGAAVQCYPENHCAKLWFGEFWYDLPRHLRRVYVIHEINHMHHWREAEVVEKFLPVENVAAYLREHEQSTDSWAYAVLNATEGRDG